MKNTCICVLALVALITIATSSAAQTPTGAWNPTGSMATVRSGASATVLHDGRVLVSGGADANGSQLSSAEWYDAKQGAFSAAAAMFLGRSNHISVRLYDGRVLVAGGQTNSGPTSEAEIYDPSTDRWTIAGSMLSSRSGHTATLLQNGCVLIAGGEGTGAPGVTLEVFDPLTDSFSFAGVLSVSRRYHAAALLPDGRVLIAGGFDGAHVLSSTEMYDPDLEWTTAGPTLTTPRAGHSATTLLNGSVLIAGGASGSSDLVSAEIYDAATGIIAPTGPMHSARNRHSAFLLPNNNSVLIVGGTAQTAELFQSWNSGFAPTGSTNSLRFAGAGAALSTTPIALMAGGANASAEIYGFATIKTDHDDYAPAQTVTITGSGWTPGERVEIKLTESPTSHDERVLYAVADAAGMILNSEFAPESHDIGVRFYATARGIVSQAQTTFTDGNATVSGTVVDSVTNVGIVGATVECFTGCNGLVTTLSIAGGAYTLHPTFSGNGPVSLDIRASASGHVSQTVTLPSISNNNSVVRNFSLSPLPASTLSVAAASGTYGGSVTLSAVLTVSAGGAPLAGKLVSFTLNGAPAGSATTDGAGAASVVASLTGINAGTYVAGAGSGVRAKFAGDSSYKESEGTNTLTVNAKGLTPSITADDKTYDGTTAATFVCTVNGVLNIDAANVNCTGGSAVFDDPHVGTRTATATGLGLSGSAAGNYSLSPTTASDNAQILPLTIAPAISADDKTYDGTKSATFTCSLPGVIAADVPNVSCSGSATFADPNVGTWQVTASGLVLSGSAAANYNLSPTTASASAKINALSITPTIDANDKTYDGTTAAIFTCGLTGIVAGDVGNVECTGGSAAFADFNVGKWTVTATGLGLSGSAAGNYSLSSNSANHDASITPLTVHASITADDKAYDGTTAAAFTCAVSGILDADNGHVTCGGGSASFADQNVGTWSVTATGLGLSGSASGNYGLASTTASDDADIKPREVKASITANDKVYDATTAATFSCTLNGVVAADNDNVKCNGGSGTFADPNVGTWIVTVTGLSLTGSAAGNYVLSAGAPTDDAEITRLTVAPSIDANDKQYDGTAAATFTCSLSGVPVPDAGRVGCGGGSGVFAEVNVGLWKVVASGLVLNGSAAVNYVLSPTTAESSAHINPLTVTVSINADNKVYDATVAATFTCTLHGVLPADVLNLNCFGGAASFASPNVGTWPVLATGLSLGGLAAGNYLLSPDSATGSAQITPKQVTVSIHANDKMYDATLAATFTCTVATGVLAVDVLATGCGGGSASFDNRNVGMRLVTVNGLTLTGGAAGNYALSPNWASDNAEITPRPASVTPNNNSKYYGQLDPNPLTTGTLTNFMAVDGITPTYSRTPGEAVGPYPISAGLNPSSALSNYTITYNTATFTINNKPTTISYTGAVTAYSSDCVVAVSAQLREGLAPFNPIAGATVTISVGVQSINLVTNSNGVASGVLSISQGTGTVVAKASYAGVDPYSGSTSSNVNFSIAQNPYVNGQPTQLVYTGSLFFWTTNPSSGTATLTLSATVKDLNPVCAGDMRKAKITFGVKNGNNTSPLSNAQNLPVSLVDPNDTKVGTATAVSQYNIGSADAETLDIVVMLNGSPYETAYAYADITISKPNVGDSMIGTGTISNDLAPASNGYLAGAAGNTTSLSTNVKFNKNKTNAQGKISVIVKSWRKADGSVDSVLHTYLIQSSSITQFTLRTGKASFGSKASIQDVTNPNLPISVDGGATLQMTFTDGSPDAAAIVVQKKDGGVWFSSGWDGTKTVEKPFTSGNITIQ